MADKRRACEKGHWFKEHGIGAGLTRKVCAHCGVVRIGEERRAVLVAEEPWEEVLQVVLAAAS